MLLQCEYFILNDEFHFSFGKLTLFSMIYRYGQVIISEKFLPIHKKTLKVIINPFLVDICVKPLSIGGIAGGEKFIVNGILFKVKIQSFMNQIQFDNLHFQFAKDTQFDNGKWLYGGDSESEENASKGAGHELVNN